MSDLASDLRSVEAAIYKGHADQAGVPYQSSFAHDPVRRLAYADLLEEKGCPNTAAWQRQVAGWLQASPPPVHDTHAEGQTSPRASFFTRAAFEVERLGWPCRPRLKDGKRCLRLSHGAVAAGDLRYLVVYPEVDVRQVRGRTAWWVRYGSQWPSRGRAFGHSAAEALAKTIAADYRNCVGRMIRHAQMEKEATEKAEKMRAAKEIIRPLGEYVASNSYSWDTITFRFANLLKPPLLHVCPEDVTEETLKDAQVVGEQINALVEVFRQKYEKKS